MSTLDDPEFGAITIRRLRQAQQVKLRIDHRGQVSISMPLRTPLFFAKTLLAESREHIRAALTKAQSQRAILRHNDTIGKSHNLIIQQGEQLASRLLGTTLRVTLPADMDPHSITAQQHIKQAALKALRTQAKAYLPRRLQKLAGDHSFYIAKVRFSNAGTRWGSCSSSGTISLNIWLMQLPFELIDYVLVHELCHTREMNHSPRFWAHVEAIIPHYKNLRRTLKTQPTYT